MDGRMEERERGTGSSVDRPGQAKSCRQNSWTIHPRETGIILKGGSAGPPLKAESHTGGLVQRVRVFMDQALFAPLGNLVRVPVHHVFSEAIPADDAVG